MQQLLRSLENLSDELGYILAQVPLGEQFNSGYFKDPENFKKLVGSDVRMERLLNRYFRGLGKRAVDKIDWFDYEKRVVRAALVSKQSDWKDEVLTLQVLITDSLEGSFEAGGLAGQTQVGLDVGFSAKQPAAQAVLRKNTLGLAKGLTETSRKRINQSLLTSIQEGHTQQEAAAQISRIIDDSRRASTIAHTEAVNAYSQGRLEVGRQVGAEGKKWRNAQPGAEEFCRRLHNKVVKLDEDFSAGPFTKSFPPLHPNCRCLGELVLVL